MSDAAPAETPWRDALCAITLMAVDPACGLSLRARPGPLRDRLLALLRDFLPSPAPIRPLPLHAGDDRLMGGLDLAATLRAGRPVAARGLLAEADGGVLLLAMAERLSPGVAARLAAAQDGGETTIGLVALDEGDAEEQPPAALRDRLAFRVELDGIGLRDATRPEHDSGHVRAARAVLAAVSVPDEMLTALCNTAAVLGIDSTRALLLALRAARAAAALGGRRVAAEADAMLAARLVLAPRATRLPPPPDAPPEESSPEEAPPDPGEPAAPAPERPDKTDDSDANETLPSAQELGEIMTQAARAAIPAGLLARLLVGRTRLRATAASGAGMLRQSAMRGRPIGVRRGELRGGARLNLVETLRAAAPWQPIRRQALRPGAAARVIVLPDDVRITRFRQRSETTTIFVVDASGSAALNRLAEAKGAVELVLAECYVRRDRVALIGFRGASAELLLPPTTSLVRARRSLAGLPGGGGTPLAAGIDAAFLLADRLRRGGQTPILLLLSDGRANVARDGRPGRAAAEADALQAASAVRAAGIAALVVDTSPRPAPQARAVAAAMGAVYLPLPYADSAALSRAVQAAGNG